MNETKNRQASAREKLAQAVKRLTKNVLSRDAVEFAADNDDVLANILWKAAKAKLGITFHGCVRRYVACRCLFQQMGGILDNVPADRRRFFPELCEDEGSDRDFFVVQLVKEQPNEQA